MNGFREILPGEIQENLFTAINDDWMLISAMKENGSFNTMTASWGGFGIMWGRSDLCLRYPSAEIYA